MPMRARFLNWLTAVYALAISLPASAVGPQQVGCAAPTGKLIARAYTAVSQFKNRARIGIQCPAVPGGFQEASVVWPRGLFIFPILPPRGYNSPGPAFLP